MAKLPNPGISVGQRLNVAYQPAPVQPAGPKANPSAFVLAQIRSGDAFQARGDFEGARRSYQAILDHFPEHPDALHRLATAAIATGRYDIAVGLLHRAIAGKPNDASFYCDLAAAYLFKRDTASANAQIAVALRLDPDNPTALFLSAVAKSIDGQETVARRIFEALLEKNPDYMPAIVQLAGLYVALGEFEKARILYRRGAGHKSVVVMSLAGLTRCEKITTDMPEAERLRGYLHAFKQGMDEFSALHLALGRIAHNSSDYDAAFTHYAAAKAHAGPPYDIAEVSRGHDVFKEIFTPSFFAERRAQGHPSDRPVFVVGMPRSGTTLTEQIIASHADAAGAGELTMILSAARSLGLHGDARHARDAIAALSAADIWAMAERYLSILEETSSTARRVVDKMPLNFEHLGLIALLFPNAKIIHCSRNPLDTCLSCFTNPLRLSAHPYVENLTSLGAHYREYVRLMEIWRGVLPIPIYESRYEEVTESPEDNVRRMIEYVGLPWDPACLNFHETERAVHTPSVMQVRQPIYKTSVERWRRYEKHLGPLIEALGDLVPVGAERAASAAGRSAGV